MNRRTFLATAGLVPAAVRALHAQSPGVEPGFVSLFDGQTLAGWSVQEGPASAFRAVDGAIVVDQGSNFPTWLRSDKQYENFDFRCEFFLQGWTNSGIYLHAPEHGRNTWVGMKINIFHQAGPGTEARVGGFDLSARPAARGERQEPGGVEHAARAHGLAPAPGLDERHAGPGSRRRSGAGAEVSSAARIPGPRVAVLSDPLPEHSRPRVAGARRRGRASTTARGLRQMAGLQRQALVRAAGRDPARGRQRATGDARDLSRFRAPPLHSRRAASQRRHDVPVDPGTPGRTEPELRDPAPRRRRRALRDRIALFNQARDLSRGSSRRSGFSSSSSSRAAGAWSESTGRP